VYFEDLTPYRYLEQSEPNTYNVGWLDGQHAFPTGEMAAEPSKRLVQLCLNPINRTRGWHPCPLCKEGYPVRIQVGGRSVPLGDGEIRVEGADSKRYAAPNLICHYVQAHKYLPPEEFQQALVDQS
jgi:hypothetical protein